jgi:4-amino-4-deoxy-L-arabinose transferase-like glycosyltransferase
LVAGVVAAFAYERGRQRGFLASFRDGARADIAIMTVLFGVAVALRLIYVGRIMSDANYLDAGADGRIYDELAWSIASGNGVPASFSDRYPLLLLGNVWLSAAVYAIAGRSYFTLTAIQSILGALACVLVYDTARRVFDRPTAIVAGAFAAVSFPLVFAAATVGHQAWDVFFTALTVWLLVRLIATGGTAWQWMVAGAVVGLSFTIRETNIFFAALLVPWIVWFHPHGRRAAVRPLAAFVAGGALMVLPFIAPKVWSPEVRAGMRGHFDRMYRGEGGSRPTSRTELAGPLTDPSAALSQLQSDPGRVVKTLAAEYADNFAAQFLTQPYGGFDVVFLRKGSDYYYGMWFYAYALTIAGTLLVVRRLPAGSLPAAASALILGLLVARTVPHLMLASDYRHRAPLEPFLILLAAIGAVAVAREAMATAASTSTSGFTGSDWRVSQSSGT